MDKMESVPALVESKLAEVAEAAGVEATPMEEIRPGQAVGVERA
jgi:hypothetical protein